MEFLRWFVNNNNNMTQTSFRGYTGQWWRRDVSVLFSAKTYLRLHFLAWDHNDICSYIFRSYHELRFEDQWFSQFVFLTFWGVDLQCSFPASHSLLDMGSELFRSVIVNASCELSFNIQTIATYWVLHLRNYMFYMVKLRFRIKGYLKIQRKEMSIKDTVKSLYTTNWWPVYMEMGDPR